MSWKLKNYVDDLLNIYKGEDILENSVKKNIEKYYSSIDFEKEFEEMNGMFFPKKKVKNEQKKKNGETNVLNFIIVLPNKVVMLV